MKISPHDISNVSASTHRSSKKRSNMLELGIAGLAMLGGAHARNLLQAPPIPQGSSTPPSPLTNASPPPPTASGQPLPMLSAVPTGQPPAAPLVATQGSSVPAWIAAANETSSLPLAWAGGMNNTVIPGMGLVVLPVVSPLSRLPPIPFFSPWYDYMTQPTVPDNVTYMQTMQGPYYRGVIYDRGANDEIGSNDVRQGYIGNCALGAAIIALAETGRFNQHLPVGIAANAPKPYFDVKLYSAPGQLATQHIDDMLPIRLDHDVFFSYSPTPDGLGTAAADMNANAVLAVPYIEKAMAKLLDANPGLKTFPNLAGYAGLSGIQATTAMMALTGTTALGCDRRTYYAWDPEVSWLLQTPTQAALFGTPDTLGNFLAMGDSSNANAQMVSFNGDSDTMRWTNINSEAFIIYQTSSQAYVFAADHAYGLMRGQATNANVATLRNPWGGNPDINGQLTLPATLAVPLKVLQRVMQTLAFV